MSTRKLIALALGCALVILLAGGIQLVLLSNSDTQRVEALSPGQSVRAGDLQVTVVSTATTDGTARISASLAGPGDLKKAAEEGFHVRARQEDLLVIPEQSSCQQIGTRVACELVFDTGTTNLSDAVVVFKGAKASWSLAAA